MLFLHHIKIAKDNSPRILIPLEAFDSSLGKAQGHLDPQF